MIASTKKTSPPRHVRASEAPRCARASGPTRVLPGAVAFLLILAAALPLHAQRCPLVPEKLNAGMPWTVVEDADLPPCFPRAEDSAQIAAIRREHPPGLVIRHIFRVYHHPELLPFDLRKKVDSVTVAVEIPRERGVSEIVYFDRTSTNDHTPQGTSVTGFSGLRPRGYGLGAILYFFSDRSIRDDGNQMPRPDSVYVAFLDGLPASYRVWDGIPGYRRWGYFVQLVDPRFHPSSVKESVEVASPRVSPSPASDRVEVAVPAGWAGARAVATVYDMTGRAALTRELQFGNEGSAGEAFEIEELPAGTYVIHLRNLREASWTQARFVKE